MTGITKQEASILWGNGFKLKDKEGKVYEIVKCENDGIKINRFPIREWIPFSAIGTDYFIICHGLDKLTQPIQHEGKEIVPIIELAKIGIVDYPHGRHIIDNNIKSQLVHLNNGCIFGYDDDGFYFKECRKPLHVSRQPALFSFMSSLHIDYLNWEERGLTVKK